jgi:nucleoid DNA-binding protein
MIPKSYLTKLASAVSKRSGICQATVEQVLPALFDEIRYQLCEGPWPCVPIESFGTFAITEKPERQYKVRGKDEWKTLPPKKFIKFSPTRNFSREMVAGQFDESRRSFSRHPQDPPIRTRAHMQCRKGRTWALQERKGRVIDHDLSVPAGTPEKTAR